MAITFTVGHVQGGEEELSVELRLLAHVVRPLVMELNDGDDSHYMMYFRDAHANALTIGMSGRLTHTPAGGQADSHFQAKSTDRVVQMAVDFLLGKFEEWWAPEFTSNSASLASGPPLFGPDRDQFGDFPLHKAAADGDLAVVQELVVAGLDVNAKDDNRNTPLVLAVLSGHLKVCKFLIERGADLKAKSRLGNSLLRLAEDHPRVADLLRKHGAT